jgi:poly-gamma-glutamate synthesis protein (capsule biosynthesis protein)
MGLAGTHSGGVAATHARVKQHHAAVAPSPITIDSIFAARPTSLAIYDKKKLRTLIATGDVIPARSVNYKMVTYNDFRYPFERTSRYLRSGDVTLINLESPLIQGCPLTDSGLTFCGDPRAVQGLTYAGVDVACTANNHIGNYGSQGIQETWQHLSAAGILHCGLGDVAYRTVRGLRFGFLAYNCVGERFDYPIARKEIRGARRRADVVVVSVHWGEEYVSVPSAAPGIADDDPVKVAHWIIDSGADLIIGNHPHHVQGVEIYHRKLITYAHGNFAFDQMFSQSTEEGVVGAYTFYQRRLVRVRYRAVHIYDYAQPRWAAPAEARSILQQMRQSSLELRRAHRV